MERIGARSVHRVKLKRREGKRNIRLIINPDSEKKGVEEMEALTGSAKGQLGRRTVLN